MSADGHIGRTRHLQLQHGLGSSIQRLEFYLRDCARDWPSTTAVYKVRIGGLVVSDQVLKLDLTGALLLTRPARSARQSADPDPDEVIHLDDSEVEEDPELHSDAELVEAVAGNQGSDVDSAHSDALSLAPSSDSAAEDVHVPEELGDHDRPDGALAQPKIEGNPESTLTALPLWLTFPHVVCSVSPG